MSKLDPVVQGKNTSFNRSYIVNLTQLFSQPISNLNPAEPICVSTGTPLDEVIEVLQENRIGCALVTQHDHLVGIITERDFAFKILGHSIDLESEIVDSFMTRDPETLSSEHPVSFALNRMKMGGYRHVPLVNQKGEPTGIISVKDIVHWLVEEFPTEILNLPPQPSRFSKSREGA